MGVKNSVHTRNGPVSLRRGRVWSLWELIEELKLGRVVEIVHDLMTCVCLGTDDSAPLKSGLRELIERDLRELLPECQALDLDVATDHIKTALRLLGMGPTRGETGAMARSVNITIKAIEIQLRSRLFLGLRPEGAKLFRETHVMGAAQDARFSAAVFELDEAAKCLSLDRSTAGAFHAIRCLESGIGALSRCLKIPDPTKAHERSWAKLLKALKDAIDAKWPTSTNRLSGDGEFFDNAYAALAAMQNPWRNATMHLDHVYTEPDAQRIFNAVKGFMEIVANRMDENGEPFA